MKKKLNQGPPGPQCGSTSAPYSSRVHWLKTLNYHPHSSALAQFAFTEDMKPFGQEAMMVVYCNIRKI